ncbi:MAG: M13 family metallopeptidase, partial [Treponema sp.]|nr:M13 family metallopeptidase [Treponema sp.]
EKVYDDNQFIKVTKNLKLYAIWKMNEGSGSATESKEWIFDSWKDNSIRPGDDFFNYVIGNWKKDPNNVGYWHKTHESDDIGIFENQGTFCEEFINGVSSKNSEIGKNSKVFAKAAELFPVTDEQKQAEIEVLKKRLNKIDQITDIRELLCEYVNTFTEKFSICHILTDMTDREDFVYQIIGDYYYFTMINKDFTTLESIFKYFNFENSDKIIEEFKKLFNIDDSNEKTYIQTVIDFIKALNSIEDEMDEENDVMKDILFEYLKENGVTVMPKTEGTGLINMNFIGAAGKDALSIENAKTVLKFGIAVSALDAIFNYKDSLKTEAYLLPLIKAFKDVYDPDGTRKAYVNTICEELRAKFRERLQNNTWMSKSSKENAIEKLNALYFFIGYPDTFPQEFLLEEDFSKYNSYIEFFKAITDKTEYNSFNYYSNKDNSVRDKAFFMTIMSANPIDSNAYYMPWLNAVNILVSNLGGEVIKPELPDAYNYAFIGYIVGHELCHAFDGGGSKYDENGKTRDWWAVSDKLRYEDKKAQMVQLYNMFTLDSDSFTNVNGEQTLDENMADFGGFSVVYDVFVSKKIKEGFSGEELIKQKKMFFETLALDWSSVETDEDIKYIIETNSHSPRPFRVNGITCLMDDWYDLYNVQPGDRYYLEPSQRIVLW